MVKDPVVRASNSLGILFPTEWLEVKAEGDPRGRTNRQIETEVSLHFFFLQKILDLTASSEPFEAILCRSASAIHWYHLADGSWTDT